MRGRPCWPSILVFALLVRRYAEGITCHICKFSGPPNDWGINCNDPFNINGTLRECTMDMFYDSTGSLPPPNTTAFFCRKTVQRVEAGGEVKLLVKRSCGWEDYVVKGRECYHAGTLKYNTMSCVCYTDGCNSALKLHGPTALGLHLPAMLLASLLVFVGQFKENFVSSFL